MVQEEGDEAPVIGLDALQKDDCYSFAIFSSCFLISSSLIPSALSPAIALDDSCLKSPSLVHRAPNALQDCSNRQSSYPNLLIVLSPWFAVPLFCALSINTNHRAFRLSCQAQINLIGRFYDHPISPRSVAPTGFHRKPFIEIRLADIPKPGADTCLGISALI
jgi:hypothetical protein